MYFYFNSLVPSSSHNIPSGLLTLLTSTRFTSSKKNKKTKMKNKKYSSYTYLYYSYIHTLLDMIS